MGNLYFKCNEVLNRKRLLKHVLILKYCLLNAIKLPKVNNISPQKTEL